MSDEATRRDYSARRIGERLTLGNRPAVLVIDLQYGFTDRSSRSPRTSRR